MIDHIEVFRALGDPTRMQILQEIGSGEHAVGHIAERMAIQQSGVSRHLRILQSAGLVRMRADKQRRLYALRQEAFDELDRWVAAYRRQWEGRLDRFGTALARKAGSEEMGRERLK